MGARSTPQDYVTAYLHYYFLTPCASGKIVPELVSILHIVHSTIQKRKGKVEEVQCCARIERSLMKRNEL